MIDLQNQMRMRTDSGKVVGGVAASSNKYTEYLNRFSTSSSIEQTQNLQGKYHELKS